MREVGIGEMIEGVTDSQRLVPGKAMVHTSCDVVACRRGATGEIELAANVIHSRTIRRRVKPKDLLHGRVEGKSKDIIW